MSRASLSFLVIAVAAGAGCAPSCSRSPEHAQLSEAATVWTCSMHPGVRLDHPGSCPICGMDLVPLASLASAAEPGASGYYCPMHPSYRSDRPGDCPVCNMTMQPVGEHGAGEPSPVEGRASVVIAPEGLQLIGVRSAPVVRERVSRRLRAYGRVELDERTLSAVSLRTSGWVEELLVKTVGEAVEPGQVLFSLYSPELFEAQAQLLLARDLAQRSGDVGQGGFERANLASARARLQLLGVADEDLVEIEGRAEPLRALPVRARTRGVVMRREIVAGARVEAGATLYELADLAHVWILAELAPRDLAGVASGATAEIELESAPEALLRGRVAHVYPTLDERTRTVRVRIEVENPDGALRPGAFATVRIASDLGEQLLIDDDSLLDTGTRRLVFVSLGQGRFEPREVEIGARFDGRAVVLSGLTEGEAVVSRGTFLIDSESRLRAALARHAGGHEGH